MSIHTLKTSKAKGALDIVNKEVESAQEQGKGLPPNVIHHISLLPGGTAGGH